MILQDGDHHLIGALASLISARDRELKLAADRYTASDPV